MNISLSRSRLDVTSTKTFAQVLTKGVLET